MQQASTRSDISVVIIAKNAVHTLDYSLRSACALSADVILVLDPESDDDTEALANNYPVKIIKTPWMGYGRTKNFGNDRAKNDWILSLDADEYLDDKLLNELRALSPQDKVVYLINRLTYVGDTPIKHGGWYPDWKERLFNRKFVRWDDKPVHESLVIAHDFGRVKLSGLMHHLSVKSFSELDERLDRYARLRAEEWMTKPRKQGIVFRLFRPSFRFFRNFVLRRGFLDGSNGWKIAKSEYLMIKKQYQYYDLMKRKIEPTN